MNQPWLFCFRSISICLFFLMIQCIARADLIFHTTETTFTPAISGRPRTILNFDGINEYNSPIASGSFYNNTVSFSTALRITDGRDGFSTGSGQPASVPGLNTHSGTNFLGTGNAASFELISGSTSSITSITLNFRVPSNGIGLYVISDENLNDSDVSLRVGTFNASLNGNAFVELNGNANKATSFGYFLGITETNPSSMFSSAELRIAPRSLEPIRFGIDSMIVAVPEPSSIAFCVLGLAAASLVRIRRTKRNA
jgi:hypothetical protein